MFFVVLGLLMGPISEHNFTMHYLQQMFLVRTEDPTLFEKTKLLKKNKKPRFKSLKVKIPESLKGTEVEKETSKHLPVKVSFLNNLRLFFQTNCGIFGRCFGSSKHSKALKKLLEVGQKRIERDLSIENIVKSLRDIKILLRNNLMDHETQFQIQHDHKNVIDLEKQPGKIPIKEKKSSIGINPSLN